MYNLKFNGEVVTYMKVEKKDGRVLYYKVQGEAQSEISEEEYIKENNNG